MSQARACSTFPEQPRPPFQMQGVAMLGPPATTVESLYGVKGLYQPKLIGMCGLHCGVQASC